MHIVRLNTVQQTLAVLCALLMATSLFAQSTPLAPASEQTPAGQPQPQQQQTTFTQVGPHDYSITTPTGKMEMHIPTSRGEADQQLRLEKKSGVTTTGAPDLTEVNWKLITHWGDDPIVEGGISSVPPAPAQMSLIRERIDNNPQMQAEEKQELIRKIETGDCVSKSSLEHRFGEFMLNGGKVLWKYEVSPAQASKTRNCEMYLNSTNRIVSLVYACANLHFPFVTLKFIGPPGTAIRPPETPEAVKCLQLTTVANGSYTAQFSGPVASVTWVVQQQGGGQQLVLPGTIAGNSANLIIAPSQYLNPNAAYTIVPRAFTAQGAEVDMSECIAQTPLTFTTPPPTTVTTTGGQQPPIIINNKAEANATGGKAEAKVKGGNGKWVALGLILGGAAIAVGLALMKRSNVNVNVNQPTGPTKTFPTGGA